MAMPKKKQSESHTYDFREKMAQAKKAAGAKKKLRGIHVDIMDNGGHNVVHHFMQREGGMMPGHYNEPETHAFGKHEGRKMMAHIKSALGMTAGAGEPDADDEA